ncbi:helix-turn-helix transcriptional regulator [Nocardioides iriomotensis]|uniref:HTH luxR-type domain-containing protein n=1 Tax=Nocardioides iriomotensis TaxID=715784 RepID=A0A4Q5IU74_9ACTN|nr:AAA family ATPase [Nocardioides iriomotensis]RYU09417.1 hypothetical protein ETU37_20330 [Nocardioides iriomotensis]
MTEGGRARQPRIAGRVRERGLLATAIQDAAGGRPGAVFVHGEAGVGKTRLVREAADEAVARGFAVLWGSCLRFGAVESVLLPWVVALDRWVAEADDEDRRAVLAGVAAADQLLPSLGGGPHDGAPHLAGVAETLLARVVARRPTVLVLDDVQWADAASRDVLSFLVAGFARQRVLVLGTCRDEGLPAGDPTFGWLADLRRMPQVTELTLGRLTREETEEQLAGLLDAVPAPGLVAAVHDRSGGNAYLSELLAHGLAPGAERLPRDLPGDLATALLAAWHRLAPATREVVRVLAVAGRPVPLARLQRVCASLGVDTVGRAVTEAATAGTVVARDDRLWLRHPLLADVLNDTYLPGEAAPVHLAWAATLEAEGERGGVPELRRLGDVALHRERGGDVDAAFVASLAAADAARRMQMWQHEPVHLQRAAALWQRVSEGCRDGVDEAGLLERAAIASVRVGQDREGVELGRRALALAELRGDDLQASRLTIWVADAAWWLGEIDQEPVAQALEAVALAAVEPDSREHADALTSLAQALGWEGRWRVATPIADRAVEVARRSGSREALAAALGARSALPSRPDGGLADSEEGLRLAVESGDPDVIQWAAQWRCNALVAHGRLRDATGVSEWALAESLDSGALAAALWHASGAARGLADQGRLADAAAAVRTGLGLTGVGNGSAALRLSAAVVAVRRGDVPAARLHVQRAEEQIPSFRLRPGLEAPPVLAELLVAEGRPFEALVLMSTTMSAHAVDPRITDLMLLRGIGAAADLAVQGRDRADRQLRRLARRHLYWLARARNGIPGEAFTGPDPRDPVLAAWRALRGAELARFDGLPSEADRWAVAVRCCRDAGLGWDAAVATTRWCAALLAAGADRERVTGPLREAHAYAVREGAAGLRAWVERLAGTARVALAPPDTPTVPVQRTGNGGRLAGLTPREREVLRHLVAGDTYAQIGQALFISEKTVSVHVSNLLRKTGTSSRQEVAALALRIGTTG